MFGLFKRKDPICGMKEVKGTGIENEGKWFCSEACLEGYKKQKK
jgi:YHS domain-containing protein